jgi:hypothetical protein
MKKAYCADCGAAWYYFDTPHVDPGPSGCLNSAHSAVTIPG